MFVYKRALLRSLLGGAAALALAGPSIAQAGSDADQPPQAAANTQIADIVVTAQRREERAQSVPVAVTVLSGETLGNLNITQPQDLYGSVPSLIVGNQGQQSREVQAYSIRGQAQGYLASPAVAVYMSEVPLPATTGQALQGGPGQFVDLENVQVLAGPQGTLFGRNTTGGAVLLTPRRPGNELGGYIEGGIGNYKLRSLEGALNLPVVADKLMVRVSGAYHDRRGFTKDLVWDKWRDDTHWYAGRIGILARPTERLENYLVAYGSKSETNGPGFIHEGFNIPGLAGRGYCVNPPAAPAANQVSCEVYQRQSDIAEEIGPRATRSGVDGRTWLESWGLVNTTQYELSDELLLRNIVSYHKLKYSNAYDQDGTPIQQNEGLRNRALPTFPIPGFTEYGLPATTGNVYTNARPDFDFPREYVKEFTEELQLQGNMLDKHLTFTVGGFFYDQRPAGPGAGVSLNGVRATSTGITPASVNYAGVTNTSRALYGQATLDLGAFAPTLEKLRLTGGYRYTWDRISGFSTSWSPILGTQNATCSVGGGPLGTVSLADAFESCRFSNTLRSKAPTWTVGLDYQPMPHLFLYGKISRGYKAGGFNVSAVRVEAQTFAPEKLLTYEAGFKSDWTIGGTPVRLNATYYYSDYKNIQKPAGDFNPSTGLAGAQILGAAATIQGVEAEATIRPFKALQLSGNVSYTDPRFTSFTQVTPFGALACNGVIPPGGTADFSCLPYAQVNKWAYNINGTLTLPIPEHLGSVSLFVNYSYVSSQPTSPTTFESIEPGSVLESYGLLKASLDWRDVAGQGIDLSLFATNLTNKLYRVGNSNVWGSSLYQASLYGEPRMYGLKLRFAFGGK